MAEYINDIGPYDQDAQFSGTKSTDYDYSETNEIVWFSGTGTASTGFTLPDSPFIMFEVYEPDAYTNNLTGGNIVHGTKEFTTEVGTVANTIADWRTAYIAVSPFTTFKLKATHYKGSDLADVYDGDESTTFGTATDTNVDFTAHSAEWVMGDALFSEYAASGPLAVAYVSMDGVWQTEMRVVQDANGKYINHARRDDTTPNELVWSDNTSSGIFYDSINLSGVSGTDGAGTDGTDLDHILGFQLTDWWRITTAPFLYELDLPSGTYNIYTTASQNTYSTTNDQEAELLTEDSVDVRGYTPYNVENNSTEYASFLNVAGGRWVRIRVKFVDPDIYAFMGGITIEKIA